MNAWTETMIAAAHQAYQAGAPARAEAALRYVLGASGRDAWVVYFLGHLAYLQGRLADATALLTDALAMDPYNGPAHNDLGETLRAQRRLDEALPHFERAIELARDLGQAYGNLTTTLLTLGRPEDALRWAQVSLHRASDKAVAHCDLGSLLTRLNRHQEALRQFELALQVNPAFAHARYFESMTRLALGELPAAWTGYEARLALPLGVRGRRNHPQPRWDGTTPLDGRTIILHAEQGLGDTLQFARFAPVVAARGGRVLLDVQPELKRLLAGMPGIAAVFAHGETLPAADLQCPLMSLPFALQAGLDSLPPAPYLIAPEAASASWAKRLGPWRKMRIGLAWAGNPGHPEDRNRSIPLEKLLPLLEHPDVEFHVVQRDNGEEDSLEMNQHQELADHSESLTDFTETAGLQMQMDLVIAVDTALVHLAGALGRPAWVLLAFAADWRWLRERADSPWYPTLRLFRQPHMGDWQSVLDMLARNLDQWAVQR